ncbi:MAG: hypothetical protein WD018_05455 [Nitrosopumilaceae archaeon]
MIHIVYTQYFKDFLEQFKPEKQNLIKNIIEKYCDGAVLLPRPESSRLQPEILKVAIPEASVIMFYIEIDNTWFILTGIPMFDRVA